MISNLSCFLPNFRAKRARASRGPYHCSNCQNDGHTKRKCPLLSVSALIPSSSRSKTDEAKDEKDSARKLATNEEAEELEDSPDNEVATNRQRNSYKYWLSKKKLRLNGQHYPQTLRERDGDVYNRGYCQVCSRKVCSKCVICDAFLCQRGVGIENCYYKFHTEAKFKD